MKHLSCALLVGTVTLTLALPTLAQQSPAPQQPQRGGPMAQLDTNGDGKLSRDELKSRPRLAQNFDKLDTNKDGYLSRDELRAARDLLPRGREGKANPPPAKP